MIVLFGGTFDPVHNGHLHAARAVLALPEVEEVRLLVSADPPHRTQTVPASARHEMLVAACSCVEGLVADDVELMREGPSYSVDTLAHFRARYPTAPLVWVIGLDAFLALATWHQYREIVKLAHLLVLERPGAHPEFEPALKALLAGRERPKLPATRAGAVVFLAREMLDISASDVRARLARGEDVADLLPEPVHTYIKAHRLYVDPMQ